QGVPTGTTAISSISRSGNLVTATLASAEPWPSGTNVTITGCADPTFNGVSPVWYQTDTSHIAYSQSGANASTTGCTAAVNASGVTAGTLIEHDNFWPASQAG